LHALSRAIKIKINLTREKGRNKKRTIVIKQKYAMTIFSAQFLMFSFFFTIYCMEMKTSCPIVAALSPESPSRIDHGYEDDRFFFAHSLFGVTSEV
jgi:hypothetical protein